MRAIFALASAPITSLNLEYGFNAWFGGNLNREIEWAQQLRDESRGYVNVQSIRMSDFLPPKPAELDAALDIIKRSTFTYVHCLHGVDRTGFVIAAYRVKVQGWTWEEAYGEMLHLGFHLFPYALWLPSLKKYLGVQ
jgi:hypothetical protein